MPTTDHTALETVHRLLFRALVAMRAHAHEQNDKLTYHLADLFHGVVLEMENAAKGRSTYQEVLRTLEEKATEQGCERWLSSALAQMEGGSKP